MPSRVSTARSPPIAEVLSRAASAAYRARTSSACAVSRLLAESAPDLAYFRKAGMRVGWTQGDLRTHELRAPLEALLDAVYAWEPGAAGAQGEDRIEAAWRELHRARMERLLGCLSTPVPKPVD